LDWSQIRETVKMLSVSVAQVEGGLKIGDESVDVLVSSFTRMVDDMTRVQQILAGFASSPERDEALTHCLSTQETINNSIVAFQFYDRLQQCLQHVSSGLKELSDIIDSPNRLYNPTEWCKLQDHIRSRYTMESEKIMFDAIHEGKSVEEALVLAVKSASNQSAQDEIEFF